MFIILLLSLNRQWALKSFNLTLTGKSSYNHYNHAKGIFHHLSHREVPQKVTD